MLTRANAEVPIGLTHYPQLQGENPGIVVGNAQPDLKEWYEARKQSEPSGNGPHGKQRLMMSSKHEALGILEGLRHWGFR